jgi:hypothetical protein
MQMPRKNVIDDDDDGGEGWLEQPKINYLPELKALNESLRKEFSKSDENAWVINRCIEQLLFRRTAYLFGMTAAPLIESWKASEKPIITARAPETLLCDSRVCDEHPPAPSYVAGEKTIHAPRTLADRILRLVKSKAYDWPKNEEVLVLREQVARAFHHQKNEVIYAPSEPYSPGEIDKHSLIGCIGRLAQHQEFYRGELEMRWDKRTEWYRKYAHTVKRTTPGNVLRRARHNHDGYLMRFGFGYALAHEIVNLAELADVEAMDFGDGGDCGWASMLRLLLPARNLKHATELLYEKANGKPDNENAELWARRKMFYFAVAGHCSGLRNFIYLRKPSDFRVG